MEKQKYIVPRVDGDFLFGKHGKDGVMAMKTKMGMLCATGMLFMRVFV